MYNFEEVRMAEHDKYGLYYPPMIDEIRRGFFNSAGYGEKERFYYSFGGAVCGPVFTTLCEWAVQTAQKENIKLIFPLMREGQLYSKLLKAIISLSGLDIRVEPIYVSRTSSYYAMCYGKFDREFFREITLSSPGSIGNSFHKLGLDAHRDIIENGEERINTLIRQKKYEVLDEIFDEIVKRGLDDQLNERIDSVKSILGEYLLQHGGSESFITLDFGSMGTLPQAIDNSARKDISKIHLFLGACQPVLKRIARGHDIRFLLNNYENESEITDLFFSNFSNHFFETITMGNTKTGTAIGYKKDSCGKVQVICDAATYREPLRKAVDIIQEGILDFCIKYIKFRQDSEEVQATEQMLSCGVASFCRLIDVPLIEEVKNLGWFEYDDSVRRTSVKFVAQQKENGSYIPMPLPDGDIRLREQDVSKWTQGSLLLNSRLEEWKFSASDCRKVVVYGCGRWGRVMLEKLQNYDVEIVCIVDQKQAGGTYMGKPIISTEELKCYDFEDVIIATVNYADEIDGILEEFAQRYSGKFRKHHIIR